MKVIIVGLPYFSKYLADSLQKRFSKHKFISLNTYYSNKDKLKFLFNILSADVVHSINGTLCKSIVLELAMNLKKKLIFHWVGTDLIKATELYKSNSYKKEFIHYPLHITDSPWFVDDLKKIDIDAKFIPLKGFESGFPEVGFSDKFNVLCYISQDRAEFYGIGLIIEIAKKLPDINFNLVGISSYKKLLPKNIHLQGWVDNMSDWIKNATICLRLPKTDGLSFFILESLAQQRYVGYNKDFKYSTYCSTADDFVDFISSKKSLFDKNSLTLNTDIAKQITEDFSQDKIMDSIMNIYQN